MVIVVDGKKKGKKKGKEKDQFNTYHLKEKEIK
jgi:hypothetical protein